MSMDLHVCWRGDLAWDRARLKGALDALGFDATVLYDFEGSSGFWPVDLAGCKTGVEVYFDDNLAELTEMYPELAAAVDGHAGRPEGISSAAGAFPEGVSAGASKA